MRHHSTFSALATLLLSAAATVSIGCSDTGEGTPDIMFEDRDAGNDSCTNSTITCNDLSRQPYQVCMTEDNASCYLRRNGVRYDCAECGTVGGCFEASERLVAEQCPASP
ncbi:MAG: hypothetical protein R3B40_05490 [Polyangiales bacterium]